MIQIYPNTEKCLDYIDCEYQIRDIIFSGMRILVVADTEKYGEILADTPFGNGNYSPFFYSRKFNQVYPQIKKHWFGKLLEDTVNSIDEQKEFALETRINPTKKSLIILNSLDTFYGHILLKILNIEYCLKNNHDKDLVVIIPQFLKWIIPENCNYISVDIKLKEGHYHIQNLDKTIKNVIRKYETVFLNKAVSIPNPKHYDLRYYFKKLFKTPDQFQTSHDTKKITFIWREDRTVLAGTFFEKAAITIKKKFKIDFFLTLILFYQKYYVEKLHTILKKEFKNLNFTVVGLGKTLKFNHVISDKRTETVTTEIEFSWIDEYLSSFVILGVHGSNLLIPSGLAYSTIELLPEDRIGNYLQDILMSNYEDPKNVLFRYRFVPLGTKIKFIAKMMSTMIKNHNLFKIQQSEFNVDFNPK